MNYHARQSGTEYGPLDERELKTLAMIGQINATGEVRVGNSNEWMPASEISVISHLLKPGKAGEAELPRNVPVNDSPPVHDSSSEPSSVRVVDIDMPFGSMVLFMVKWALASIPAVIILSMVLGVIMWFVSQFIKL